VSRIEVRIAQRGSVRDGAATRDAQQAARCDLCHEDVDAVASTAADGAGPFACKACLRHRLEAMTVGSWLLRESGDGGLPWGKVSG
jgi:hypothetical protein